jgi:hypothetical protein
MNLFSLNGIIGIQAVNERPVPKTPPRARWRPRPGQGINPFEPALLRPSRLLHPQDPRPARTGHGPNHSRKL